ncbi:DUF952 domain-containing protein [Marinobacter mangrovi]|uniref:DUF952 domain-containing protein n=1 Tax=Marinobacter mangrovi TaxID=2803918 RepID=UPI001933AFA7|nr:DUF952 domain-containing protein [Marinobacter mangrovi]
MEVRHLYRVISAKGWWRAHRSGVIEPCQADRRAGLMHLSTRDQVEAVAVQHFSASEFPVVVELDVDHFRDDLHWQAPTMSLPGGSPMLRGSCIDMGWVSGLHLLLFSEQNGNPRCTMKAERLDWGL